LGRVEEEQNLFNKAGRVLLRLVAVLRGLEGLSESMLLNILSVLN